MDGGYIDVTSLLPSRNLPTLAVDGDIVFNTAEMNGFNIMCCAPTTRFYLPTILHAPRPRAATFITR